MNQLHSQSGAGLLHWALLVDDCCNSQPLPGQYESRCSLLSPPPMCNIPVMLNVNQPTSSWTSELNTATDCLLMCRCPELECRETKFQITVKCIELQNITNSICIAVHDDWSPSEASSRNCMICYAQSQSVHLSLPNCMISHKFEGMKLLWIEQKLFQMCQVENKCWSILWNKLTRLQEKIHTWLKKVQHCIRLLLFFLTPMYWTVS
jgi:hypothetical protein